MQKAPYIAERAIVLAAGRGERMRPLTDEMPKPMAEAGFPEIYVVRGYRGGQLTVLKEKYPMLRFIDNPRWREENNIASLLAVGDLVENAMIVEGDLFLRNASLLCREQQSTNYLAIPVKETADWCFFPDEAGVIRRMAIGGVNCWKMVGISYWTAEDGRKLVKSLRRLYRLPGGHARYWDEAALAADIEDFTVYVRRCTEADVQELDTMAELEALRRSLEGKG